MSAWDHLPAHLLPSPGQARHVERKVWPAAGIMENWAGSRDCFAMEGSGGVPAEGSARQCPRCGRRSVAVQPDGGLRCTACEPERVAEPGSRTRHIYEPDGTVRVDTGWGRARLGVMPDPLTGEGDCRGVDQPPAGPPCPWCSDARDNRSPASPPLVDIRQAGPHGSELLVVQDGQQLAVPLNYGQLVNLLERAAAGIRRCDEAR